MGKTYEEYLEELLKRDKAQKEAQIKMAQQEYEGLKENLENSYKAQIEKASHSGDDLINKEYVQKLADRKNLEQTMINMGLTDSGLNRTEITAVELNHSNRASSVRRSVQEKVDSLRQAMAEKLFETERDKTEKISQIENKYYDSAKNTAEKQYLADAEKEAKEAQKTIEKEDKQEKNNDKEWGELFKVLMDETVSHHDKEIYAMNFDRIYGLTDEQKKTLDDMKISYLEYTTPPVLSLEGKYGISPARQEELDELAKKLFKKSEYMGYKRVDKDIPSYQDYFKSSALVWVNKKLITMHEYHYLLDKYS